jgi:DNA polymerase-3 subunit alpha
VDKIDFSAIYKLMGEGRTAGVFQVESGGMTATIKNMQPTEYKQIVALIALYRPGPLGAGMVTSYIKRMNGARRSSTTTTASPTSSPRPTARWSTRSRSCRSR